MKKHILVLLFLLLTLIITCVYQKTYTIYSQQRGEDSTSTQNLKHEVVGISKENEIATKQKTLTNQTTKKDVTHDKYSAASNKVMNVITPVKNGKVPVSQGKEILPSSTDTTMHTKTEEKEVIDYLLSVMKERDIVLLQRDKEEAKLHALIKKALENRRLAIENMHQVSTQIEKEHQARLAERDAKAQNTSQEKGK